MKKITSILICSGFALLSGFTATAQEKVKTDTASTQKADTAATDRMPVVRPDDRKPVTPMPNKEVSPNEDGMPVKSFPDSTMKKPNR